MRFVLAVTGAQGVGKSTLCEALSKELAAAGYAVERTTQLGPLLHADGVKLGSQSNSATIPAVFNAHVERELTYACSESLILYDRCAADALAYTRTLNVSSTDTKVICEGLTKSLLNRINLIVSLQLSAAFAAKGGGHETPALREAISTEIESIVIGSGRPYIRVDAADGLAISQIVEKIRSLH
ncbi:MAG: hypothetical protein EON58_04985 [Alphaproteobacteria bacterium]|nr:MAG: hypothetical protein EON58_04985 [Alphaproteobacteria bacterium]